MTDKTPEQIEIELKQAMDDWERMAESQKTKNVAGMLKRVYSAINEQYKKTAEKHGNKLKDVGDLIDRWESITDEQRSLVFQTIGDQIRIMHVSDKDSADSFLVGMYDSALSSLSDMMEAVKTIMSSNEPTLENKRTVVFTAYGYIKSFNEIVESIKIQEKKLGK